MSKISVAVCAIALAGCGAAEQYRQQVRAFVLPNAQIRAEQNAADDATCKGYGAEPGTPVYVQCRTGLLQARATVYGH